MNTISTICAASMLLMATAARADYAAPRTAAGEPDLQGVWTNATITPVERMNFFPQLVLTKPQADMLEQRTREFAERGSAPTDPDAPPPEAGDDVGGYNSFWIDAGTTVALVNGEYRSSLITSPADGKLPYTPAAQAKRVQLLMSIRDGLDGPEQRPLGERCLVGFGSTSGPPMLPVLYNNNYQIVQAPGSVMILAEMNHDARIVRIGGEHPPTDVRTWMGDSIGHWEGDTLVVETTNFHPAQSMRACIRYQIYMSANATVTERFTRVAHDQILYQFTVDDAEAFSEPWSGEIPMRASEGPIYEYACHEGNYSLPGILAGARREARTTDEGAE